MSAIPTTIQNVILDLDETLISAVEIPLLRKDAKKRQEFERRSPKFRVHKMDEEYYIVERPGVQPFLDYLFQHYNVSVWTAASKEYAIFVLENVILRPKRKLDYFLYSDNCDASYERTGCLKQLNQLFHLPLYDSENTMIIDDNENVSSKQSNHVDRIKAFKFFRKESELDNELAQIQARMMRKT